MKPYYEHAGIQIWLGAAMIPATQIVLERGMVMGHNGSSQSCFGGDVTVGSSGDGRETQVAGWVLRPILPALPERGKDG